MARRMWFVSLLLLLIITTAEATRAYTAPAEPQTRVETDQKTGAIRFIVKGREEARIDVTGLHVRQRIDHSGADTNYGDAATYDKRMGAK